MTQAILIDAAARTITAVEYEPSKLLQFLQAAVGGYIEVAASWTDGDVLFVNEEGLLRPTAHWFKLSGKDQPLNGNGIVVGPELEPDDDGVELGNAPPGITVDALSALVRFMSAHEVSAWAKANASDPAASMSFWNDDGTVETTALGSVGALFDVAPGKAPKS